MTDLCKLAVLHGTDKAVYTAFYSMLLEHRRYQKLKVLEIGIGTPAAMAHVPGYQPGASLRMWEEYFTQSLIFGMDKDPEAMVEGKRIKTFQANQSVPAQYREFAKCWGPFDVVVDDGSHNAEHQLITLNTLLPHLAPGGVYIIEDVNTPDGLVFRLPVDHSDVLVKRGSSTGHCVVIHG